MANSINDIAKLKDINNNFVQDMYKTLSYLKGEGVLKTALESDYSVNVSFKKGSTGFFDDRGGKDNLTLGYDPSVGTVLVPNSEVDKPITGRKQTGKVQSPALGFLHELGHFTGWTEDEGKTINRLKGISDKYYGNKEEQRVGSKIETPAARRLNEPVSTNHYGIPVITEGPTSRKNIGYPGKLQLQFELKKVIRQETKGSEN